VGHYRRRLWSVIVYYTLSVLCGLSVILNKPIFNGKLYTRFVCTSLNVEINEHFIELSLNPLNLDMFMF
jgi:hypothetical protein